VTGEPGTGKSQLAESVAYQLGLDAPYYFETKSTSIARDLFYSLDNVGRFRAAQTPGASGDPRLFLTFNALGLAILNANDRASLTEVLSPDHNPGPRRRSVVLIDEIDKAPRDFPNDILNEIERLYFRVPELGNIRLSASQEFRPVVIMTSNSEKSLPDAFLRRCIFYSIPYPDDERIERILLSRLAGRLRAGQQLLRDSVAFVGRLRQEDAALRKRPGTAELINWMAAMLEVGCDPELPLREQASLVQRTLSTLLKTVDDQDTIALSFKEWLYKK